MQGKLLYYVISNIYKDKMKLGNVVQTTPSKIN